MMTNYTPFNEKELKRMNQEIVPLFGTKNAVKSGSYHEKTYNITIGDTWTHKSFHTLNRIGKMVKEIVGANEVYCLGTRIA